MSFAFNTSLPDLSPMCLARKRILIVEDEALVAEAIRLRLEQLGYVVVGVTGRGEEAVEMAAAAAPDLVLMDIRLAGAMDGITAGERIQSRFGLPVVYLTANTDRETMSRVLSTGPAGYVPKPINDAAFQSAISIALQKDALERAHRRWTRYYVSTLARLEEAVFVLDADRRLVFCNPAAAALIGCTSEEGSRLHLSDGMAFFNEAGDPIDPVAQCLASGEELSVAGVWCQSRTGERVPANVEVIPLPGAPPDGDAPPNVEVVLLLRRAPASPPPTYIRVCAYCRDIMERDADGVTVTMRFETYFQRSFGHQFTHGICPACRDALMRERQS